MRIYIFHFYCPQQQLREDNVFRGVCQSFERWVSLVPCPFWGSRLSWGVGYLGGIPYPPPHHISGRYASYWNAFLLMFVSYLPSANEVAERLCFYTCLSFCPQGSVCRHPPGSRHPWEADTPSEADTPPPNGYCCGRYASYWNAFLFREE